MKSIIILSVLPLFIAYSQVPDSAFNPMTAPGAKNIHPTAHFLYWENPEGTLYNEIYLSDDSLLVAQSDTSVRLVTGYPDSVYDHLAPGDYLPLDYVTKYYWKVVEYDSAQSADGEIWYFTTRLPSFYFFQDNFDTFDWTPIGPNGLTNWSISSTNFAGGGQPPELMFNWSPSFNGTSYLMSPPIPVNAIESSQFVWFDHFVDWFADPCGPIGFAYSIDDGNTWTSLWEITPQSDIGPELVTFTIPELPLSGEFRVAFYYSGDSFNIDAWYIDDLTVGGILTPPEASGFLFTKADTTELKVFLEWMPAFVPDPLDGYKIERKDGLPEDNSDYLNIAVVDGNILTYEDYDVELNKTYTYRVSGFTAFYSTGFGNESTAYVPPVVPVELISFSASVNGNSVLLNWETVTETNNSGFDIQRMQTDNSDQQSDWVKLSFIPGHGTTTDPQSYSFSDEHLSPGIYKYRLKQIDYDGSFEYSNTVEAEISYPEKFSLSQNYPNPFNPTTKIRYSIPDIIPNEAKNLLVSLKVYDILGREVATLVEEEKPAGEYVVEFSGAYLPSGIYFYRLKADAFSETKKLILMR